MNLLLTWTQLFLALAMTLNVPLDAARDQAEEIQASCTGSACCCDAEGTEPVSGLPEVASATPTGSCGCSASAPTPTRVPDALLKPFGSADVQWSRADVSPDTAGARMHRACAPVRDARPPTARAARTLTCVWTL